MESTAKNYISNSYQGNLNFYRHKISYTLDKSYNKTLYACFIGYIVKAIVNNFYETILFIDDKVLFRPFIKNLQNLDLDNKNDLESIMKFLKKLLWTNINDFSTLYLFQNFHLNLKKFQRKNKDKNPLEVYYHIINEMKIHYERLIDSYYKNKGILKYVK